MPLHDYQCRMQHTTERYFHTSDRIPKKMKCPVCKKDAVKIFSLHVNRKVSGYPYMEENFGDVPVEVTSPEHRQKLMKERGLREYRNPRWKGHPGAWY